MAPSRYFDSEKDDGSAFPGVPKRDLEQDEFDALPTWLQESIDASPLYRKTKPSASKAPDQPKEGD